MDQILVHLILARNPAQTWQEILPQLQNLPLSVYSLEVISKSVNNPPSLNDLLEQLNRDFAMPTGGGYAIALCRTHVHPGQQPRSGCRLAPPRRSVSDRLR